MVRSVGPGDGRSAARHADVREFTSLGSTALLPDESISLRFRHQLEQHKLAAQMLVVINDIGATKGLMLLTGTLVDATLISAPSSTINASGECDPAMRQTKMDNQWYFGMKAHIGANADSGLVPPFLMIKRQFGFTKVRYRELDKNAAQLTTLFALSKLWMARGKLMGAQG